MGLDIFEIYITIDIKVVELCSCDADHISMIVKNKLVVTKCLKMITLFGFTCLGLVKRRRCLVTMRF